MRIHYLLQYSLCSAGSLVIDASDTLRPFLSGHGSHEMRMMLSDFSQYAQVSGQHTERE
jgi:hypothetical protein